MRRFENLSQVMKSCVKFYKIEPRNIPYVIARKIIKEDENSQKVEGRLAGIALILLSWNITYILRSNRRKRNLYNDISDAYRKSMNYLKSFKNKKLWNINLAKI